jgi:hypothetical protein
MVIYRTQKPFTEFYRRLLFSRIIILPELAVVYSSISLILFFLMKMVAVTVHISIIEIKGS